jgi:hypothetical protein
MDFDLIEKVFTFWGPTPIWLVGGAPRDYLAGKEVRDYDFYTTNSLSPMGVTQVLKHLGYEDLYETEGEYSHKVYKFTKPNSPDIEIICHNNGPSGLEHLFERFDIGLCCIAIDQQGDIIRHPRFEKDLMQQTLTVEINDKNAMSMSRTFAHHLPKLTKKYPEYEVVIEQPEQWKAVGPDVQWTQIPTKPSIKKATGRMGSKLTKIKANSGYF